MSIIGAVGLSSAAYLQQLLKGSGSNAASQASASGTSGTPTFAQQAAAAQNANTTQASLPSQQSGQVHHRHHHGGGGASNPSDLLQNGTASATGTNILNTLV